MSTNATTSTEPRPACVVCDREIEACYCCASPSCRSPICARDLIIRTGESIPQPHMHGG